MTREEAIRVLRKIKENIKWDWDDSNLEALDIAIESLEKDRRETNFEHYFYDWTYKDDKVVITFDEDMTKKFLNKGKSCKLKEWLLKPYESPKYKLSKFEYDLLKVHYDNEFFSKNRFEDIVVLSEMQKNGYFKTVDGRDGIKYIFKNCEVIEECDYWMPIPEWSDNE